MRKSIFCLLAAAIATPAAAQQPEPPKLLVVISVDQLSADLFDEYRPHFTGGLARLATGTVFRNGFQSHASTETCPGHSTILTGRRPASTGIVANGWQNPKSPRESKGVYCAEDESVPGTTSSNYAVSPLHLRVPTLGELMKRAWPASRNVAVAGKDRSAVMMGGHVADQRWYWSGKAFVTDLKTAATPQSVVRANAAAARLIAAGSSPLAATPFCAGKAKPYALSGRAAPFGNGALGRAPGEAPLFRATPQFDATTLALAAALVQEMKLGTGASPDLLSVGLAGTDYVGHTYGPGGQEMCLQLTSLDRDLGAFLKVLDASGVDYAVALTADHGGLDFPERLRDRGVAAADWVDPALQPNAVDSALRKRLGTHARIVHAEGPFGDIYLDQALNGPERTRARDAAAAFYRAHPQVEAVFTSEEIAAAALPSGSPDRWPLLQRVRASFDAERSGDLYVVLKPQITSANRSKGSVGTHGSPWDYDRRVPIIFWRPGFRGATAATAVETADIMPTLAALIELPLAAGATDGRCLEATPAFCTRP
ncbi:MAG TPA: alkaline phosphatase family protein [Sphingomicrobium sp.]|jgi:predicted AlkP superfamily pyrophosphatase or phosphodiesterase